MEAKSKTDESQAVAIQVGENKDIPAQLTTTESVFYNNQEHSQKSGSPFERSYPSSEKCHDSCIESASAPASPTATQSTISPIQELVETLEKHKAIEIQIVQNKFLRNRDEDESKKEKEIREKSLEKERETVDVKSIEDDAHSPAANDIICNENPNPNGNERYVLKRTNSYSKEEREDSIPMKYYIDKNYQRYEAPVVYPKTNPVEYQYYEKLKERSVDAHQPDYSTKYFPFPTESVRSAQLMYIPVEGISDKEAMYRRAYYEEMFQREMHSQAKSAFKKPPNFEREIPEVKVLVPAMRYGYNYVPQYIPYYEQFTSQKDERDNGKKFAQQLTESNCRTERIPDKNFKDDEGPTREPYEEYRHYEAQKYAGLDPRLPIPTEYPYHSYRTPFLSWDKIHLEAKCPYPCCAGSERIQGKEADSNKLVDAAKLHALHQSKNSQLQDDAKSHSLKQSVVYDPNGIKPSFKEFLDAERQRMVEKESQGTRNEDGIAKTKRHHMRLWDQKKKDIESVKVVKNTSSASKELQLQTVKEPLKVNEFPLKENATNGTSETETQNADSIPHTKAAVPDSTNTNVKKIICSVCNKTFNRTSNLYTHMKTHSTHKPHACEFCGKRFHQKADLRIHRYIHTGEKPHKCAKCGRGFKQLTHLKYHMRTHSDVRMYKCPYCDKGFNQKSNLQAHIFGHTGQRPHKCDVCGKGFTLASTLNTHKRTHLPSKPFQCQFCERAFYQKNALKMHYVSTHPYSSGAV